MRVGITYNNLSFYALVSVMLIDALGSIFYLFGANLFCFEKKILKEESFVETFIYDNWKGGLFKASNIKMKLFAPVLLYL
jgi:hypothetical protein